MSDVKMRHPDADTNHQIKVSKSAREVYESQGWVEVGTVSQMPSAKAFARGAEAEKPPAK